MTHVPPHHGDLAPDEFRAAAHAAVDWIAEYLENSARYPVRSRVQPGELRAALPAAPPEVGEPLDPMPRDFHGPILPGIPHVNHPAFFPLVPNPGAHPRTLCQRLPA